jgi:hypothetical protein
MRSGSPTRIAAAVVAAAAAALGTPAAAQSIGGATPFREETALAVSETPDASARFVVTPGAVKPGGDVDLMLIVRNGARVQQISVMREIFVRFAAAEAEQIRWCAYLATVEQIVKGTKSCDPTNAIKDKAEYKVP